MQSGGNNKPAAPKPSWKEILGDGRNLRGRAALQGDAGTRAVVKKTPPKLHKRAFEDFVSKVAHPKQVPAIIPKPSAKPSSVVMPKLMPPPPVPKRRRTGITMDIEPTPVYTIEEDDENEAVGSAS